MMLSLCVITFLLQLGLSSSKGTDLTISECAARGGECDESKGRPVCGTDNRTYPSRCHLIRAQCSGHQVSLKHRGSCKECLEAHLYALSHRAKSPNIYVPRCRMDGTYAPLQCSEGVGCWCADSKGKVVDNTSVRNGKPTCAKKGKSNTRRSPPRSISRNNKRACTQSDESQFNTNLLQVFNAEYQRYQGFNQPSTVTDKVILDWKFSALDTNGNHMLDKIEYRELRRLVKKVVKPKRCARSFGKFCDLDNDERLSRQEWSNCLSTGGMNHERDRHPSANHNGASSNANNPNNDGDPDEHGDDGHYYDYDESEESEDDSDENIIRARSFNASHSPGYILNQATIVETDADSDCLADRAAALEDQKTGSQAIYIPECTADGRYQRVQCYRSTGYCFCVHEDTGKNIPGTPTKDKRPQCDSIYPSTWPMKGCPEPKKDEFLKNLKEFLRVKVAASASTSVNSTKWSSEDERVATLSFVLLDTNKNKVWERKEWKTFRELVTSTKGLRKCGKKMPRYCDVNNDKKITLSEWLNCLQAQRLPGDGVKPVQNESRPTAQTKLRGPNPLESYLKSD